MGLPFRHLGGLFAPMTPLQNILTLQLVRGRPVDPGIQLFGIGRSDSLRVYARSVGSGRQHAILGTI